MASSMQSLMVRTSATSAVATFSPFHLQKRRRRVQSFGRSALQSNGRRKQETRKPERVADSILKVEETVLVDAQEVPGVEVKVSLAEDVVQLLLLSLLQVSGVALERRICGDLTNQESRLACTESPTWYRELVQPINK